MRLALALLVSLSTLRAAAAASDARALTLEEVITRAEAASPVVRRALAEEQVTRAARAGAAVLVTQNPVLYGSVGGRRDRSGSVPPANGVEWGLRLELPIELAGQRGTRLREIDAAVQAAAERTRLARRETRIRVWSAYVGTQLARALVDAATQHEELAERLRASAAARVTAGAASEIELQLAAAELGRVRHERLEAELTLVAAKGELRRWLALPAEAPVEIDAVLAAPETRSRDRGELVARALVARQELAVLAASEHALDAQIVRLRREVVPSPLFFAEVAQQQPGQTYGGGGLGLPLPIFQRNQGPLAVARAERARVELERDVARREIELEVATAFEVERLRRAELDAWTSSTLPATEAALTMVEGGWRAGKLDLFRVIQVAREAAEARRRRIEVLGELWGAAIALERATGTP